MQTLTLHRVSQLLACLPRLRVLVVGDIMLDQFIWGRVSRISPEAPVPVVEFQRESFVPGGAANVARNLTALGAMVHLVGVTGRDLAARELERLLRLDGVNCDGLVGDDTRMTTKKIRVIAHQQQVVRVDRESLSTLEAKVADRLLAAIRSRLPHMDALIVGDYGKGVVSQELLDQLKKLCRQRGVWLSLDPKPTHDLDLTGLSLITPNRKEAYEMADRLGLRLGTDFDRSIQPGNGGSRTGGLSKADSTQLPDPRILQVADALLHRLAPALLLVTLGDQGMLLCRRGEAPFLIPTAAREVFDVSGAGDTVIASFTLAVAAGASPVEAAIFSNHAAGVVVAKVGTATATPEELTASFQTNP